MRNSVAIVLLFTMLAFSQQPHKGNPCSPRDTSMAQMRSCADFEFKRSDAHLDTVYQRVMQDMADDLAQARKDNDQEQISYEEKGIANLKNAESLWLSYRSAQCEAAAQRYEGGTMAPMVYSVCMKMLTEHRIDELEGIYEERPQK
jgi:uncharacterized protein YecT (DUF1311 family)